MCIQTMVKRKAAVPQRLGGDTRNDRSWNLASTSAEVLTINDSEDVPRFKQRPKKKVRKRSVEGKSRDPFLQEILSYCEFYIAVKRHIEVPEDGYVFHLGNLSLEVSGENRVLPTHDVFWLYVSNMPDCSFVYYDAKDTVDYHLIKGSLNVDLFTGLSSRCFGLQFEDPGVQADSISVRVLLFESICRSCASSKEIKFRSIVLSHFTSLSLPEIYGTGPAESKHDIEDLYCAVKDHHDSMDISLCIEIQHPSLIPELRPYQQHAVRWMIQRETEPVQEDVLDSLYVEVPTQCGQIFYYNRYSGCVVLEKPTTSPLPTGGILADEMGLGKTVEVLALILANPRNMPDQGEFADSSKILVTNETQASFKSECIDLNVDVDASFKSESINLNMDVEANCSNDSHKTLDVSLVSESDSHKRTPRSHKRSGGKVIKHRGNGKCRKQERDTVRECIEAVIIMHCYNGSEAEARKTLPKTEKKRGLLYQMLEEWYQEMLSETIRKSVRTVPRTSELECVCGEERNDLPRVQCTVCQRWQHPSCVGNPDRGAYLCPRCWQTKEPIVSGATLIVSPTSISGQWLSEIQRHVKGDFTVLIYRGVQKDGFLQPYNLANYQLVVTTYGTLRKELVHAELNDSSSPRLRHSRRFFATPSPLLYVQWWRVCLDEAQMVECTSSKTAEMARRLECVHRWAITGTPIQKSIQDLFGLIQFLGVEPCNVQRFWTSVLYAPFCRGDHKPLLNLLKHILWRTMKRDVLDQINIPAQSQQIHWLNFSPVEEHFYRLQHMLCSDDFVFQCVRFGGLNIPLRSLNRGSMNKMLMPLLRLRQACTHHQVVRGFHISQKATMTMDELLESLIKKTKLESEEALRQIIAAFNGLAGIHIIRGEWAEAVELYRDVLRQSEQYKGSLKVDTLQLIHTMHNLADILSAHRDGIPATLRDHVLQDQATELEQKYMRKCDSQVASSQEALSALTLAVRHQENNFKVGRDEWWVELLAWIAEYDDKIDLLSRVHLDLMDNKIPGQPSIVSRLKSIAGMENELALWSKSLRLARKEALKSLKDLEVLPPLDLVNEAVDCHLRTNIRKKNKCRICACETQLKTYESLLFAVSSKQTEHSLVGDVLMLGQLNKGTWKACDHERVIKVLVGFARGKHADRECMEDAATYLKWLEALKKEFKQLRYTWTQLRDQVSVRDELHMAKLRLRVRFSDEPRVQSPRKHNPLKQLSSNLTNKVETIHIIEHHEVGAHTARLNSDRLRAEDELRRKTGQLQYLKNLDKNQGCKSNPDPCPICHTELGEKWSVLQCGHCFCIECIRLLMQSTGGLRMTNVKCPICRDVTPSADISFVDISTKNPDQGIWSNISVKGSHSTKVEAVVRCLLALQGSELGAKALVFSTWEKVLDVLEKALEQNNISFRRLKPGTKYQLSLREFKEGPDEVMALLMPVRWGAKGLNLTEATHVLLVEPILNPADELQAIGRVHRIGQTKKTVVHRFLVRGTIEERIHEAVQSSKEDWSEDCVTIGQLRDLFTGLSEDIGMNSGRIGTDKNSAPCRTLSFSFTTGSSVAGASGLTTSATSVHFSPQEGKSLSVPDSYNNFSECCKNLNFPIESSDSEPGNSDMTVQTSFMHTCNSDMTVGQTSDQTLSYNSVLELRNSNCSNEVVLTDNSQFEVVMNGCSSTALNTGPCLFEKNTNNLNKELSDVNKVETILHPSCSDESFNRNNLFSDSTIGNSQTSTPVAANSRYHTIQSSRYPLKELVHSSGKNITENWSAMNGILENSFSESFSGRCTPLTVGKLPSNAIPVASNIEVFQEDSRSSSFEKPEVSHVKHSLLSSESEVLSACDEPLNIGSCVEIQEGDSRNSMASSPVTDSETVSSPPNVLEEAVPSGKYLEIPASVLLNVSEEAVPVGGYIEIPTQEDMISDNSMETKPCGSHSLSLSPNPVPTGKYIEIPASVLLNVSDKNTPVAGYIEVQDGEDSALPVGLSADMSDEMFSEDRHFKISVDEYSSSGSESLSSSSSSLSDEGVSTGEDSNSTLAKKSITSPARTSSTVPIPMIFKADIGNSVTPNNTFISDLKSGIPMNKITSPGEITLSGILSPPYSPASAGTSVIHHSL